MAKVHIKNKEGQKVNTASGNRISSFFDYVSEKKSSDKSIHSRSKSSRESSLRASLLANRKDDYLEKNENETDDFKNILGLGAIQSKREESSKKIGFFRKIKNYFTKEEIKEMLDMEYLGSIRLLDVKSEIQKEDDSEVFVVSAKRAELKIIGLENVPIDKFNMKITYNSKNAEKEIEISSSKYIINLGRNKFVYVEEMIPDEEEKHLNMKDVSLIHIYDDGIFYQSARYKSDLQKAKFTDRGLEIQKNDYDVDLESVFFADLFSEYDCQIKDFGKKTFEDKEDAFKSFESWDLTKLLINNADSIRIKKAKDFIKKSYLSKLFVFEYDEKKRNKDLVNEVPFSISLGKALELVKELGITNLELDDASIVVKLTNLTDDFDIEIRKINVADLEIQNLMMSKNEESFKITAKNLSINKDEIESIFDFELEDIVIILNGKELELGASKTLVKTMSLNEKPLLGEREYKNLSAEITDFKLVIPKKLSFETLNIYIDNSKEKNEENYDGLKFNYGGLAISVSKFDSSNNKFDFGIVATNFGISKESYKFKLLVGSVSLIHNDVENSKKELEINDLNFNFKMFEIKSKNIKFERKDKKSHLLAKENEILFNFTKEGIISDIKKFLKDELNFESDIELPNISFAIRFFNESLEYKEGSFKFSETGLVDLDKFELEIDDLGKISYERDGVIEEDELKNPIKRGKILKIDLEKYTPKSQKEEIDKEEMLLNDKNTLFSVAVDFPIVTGLNVHLSAGFGGQFKFYGGLSLSKENPQKEESSEAENNTKSDKEENPYEVSRAELGMKGGFALKLSAGLSAGCPAVASLAAVLFAQFAAMINAEAEFSGGIYLLNYRPKFADNSKLNFETSVDLIGSFGAEVNFHSIIIDKTLYQKEFVNFKIATAKINVLSKYNEANKYGFEVSEIDYNIAFRNLFSDSEKTDISEDFYMKLLVDVAENKSGKNQYLVGLEGDTLVLKLTEKSEKIISKINKQNIAEKKARKKKVSDFNKALRKINSSSSKQAEYRNILNRKLSKEKFYTLLRDENISHLYNVFLGSKSQSKDSEVNKTKSRETLSKELKKEILGILVNTDFKQSKTYISNFIESLFVEDEATKKTSKTIVENVIEELKSKNKLSNTNFAAKVVEQVLYLNNHYVKVLRSKISNEKSENDEQITNSIVELTKRYSKKDFSLFNKCSKIIGTDLNSIQQKSVESSEKKDMFVVNLIHNQEEIRKLDLSIKNSRRIIGDILAAKTNITSKTTSVKLFDEIFTPSYAQSMIDALKKGEDDRQGIRDEIKEREIENEFDKIYSGTYKKKNEENLEIT